MLKDSIGAPNNIVKIKLFLVNCLRPPPPHYLQTGKLFTSVTGCIETGLFRWLWASFRHPILLTKEDRWPGCTSVSWHSWYFVRIRWGSLEFCTSLRHASGWTGSVKWVRGNGKVFPEMLTKAGQTGLRCLAQFPVLCLFQDLIRRDQGVQWLPELLFLC